MLGNIFIVKSMVKANLMYRGIRYVGQWEEGNSTNLRIQK